MLPGLGTAKPASSGGPGTTGFPLGWGAMIAQRYDLVREIGRGGMGAVWLATDSVLGREVAVKRIGVMPGSEDADLIRAEREARLAARLNHPHVIAVYDLVEEAGPDPGQVEGRGEHWLVMEYVEGIPLSGLVRRDGALAPDQAAGLLSQTADALAAAHAAGIVHRDVKPSNILVTRDGQAKLGDFGIARAEADATLTQTGLVTGSPAYLAPEVASGGAATTASDVWALGATLYHALEGKPPYETGDNLMGALYRIVNDEPPRPANAGWLAPLLEATMTRDPRVRLSATFSAASRQMLHRRNSASPSFHSPLWRSYIRGVDATVKLATAAPDGVNRSSGSAVRFPTTVIVVSPATRSSWDNEWIADAVCRPHAAHRERTEWLRQLGLSACRSASPWSEAPTRSG